MRAPKRHKGVALITALLVLAIATIAAVQMASRQHMDIRRAQNTLARNQSLDYLLSAEAWVLISLKTDLMGAAEVDSLKEAWAQPLAVPDFQGARLSGQAHDLQGRFNLNNLLVELAGKPEPQWRQQPSYQVFRRLLENLKQEDPELEFDSHALIQALVDWMDPDLGTSGAGGAEDEFYLNQNPPYRAANRELSSPTELRLVRGFRPEDTPGLVSRLLEDRLVTALPTRAGATPINVNTAGPKVLMAAVEGLSLEAATTLAEQAVERPWESVQEFVDGTPLKNSPQSNKAAGLAVKSSFFGFDGSVSLGPAVMRLSSVIHRGQDYSVRVISRSREIL